MKIVRILGIDYKIRDFVVHTKLSNNESGEKYIGSFFLFDNWKNNCKIQINGKEFRLNNVNLNDCFQTVNDIFIYHCCPVNYYKNYTKSLLFTQIPGLKIE